MNECTVHPIRPKMLMLSHCLPQHQGDADQMRAWQLLELACANYAIHLACVVTHPVNMRQWNPLHQRTQRLALEPLTTGQRFMSWLRKNQPSSEKVRLMLRGALRNPAALLDTQDDYDAVLCTHSDLWPRVAPIHARLRICDMGTITQDDKNQHAAAWQFDVLMLRLAEDAGCFVSAPCHKLVVPFASTQNPAGNSRDQASVELSRLLAMRNRKPHLAAA